MNLPVQPPGDVPDQQGTEGPVGTVRGIRMRSFGSTPLREVIEAAVVVGAIGAAHTSNEALALALPQLEALGFLRGRTLSTINGVRYRPDAWHPEAGVMVEVEGVRTLKGNQFASDVVKAASLPEVRHLLIAVKNQNRNYAASDDVAGVARLIEPLPFPWGTLTSVTVSGWGPL